MAHVQAYQPLLVDHLHQQQGGQDTYPISTNSLVSSPAKSEMSFDQCVFQVKGVQKSYGEVNLWEAITCSLKGTAADFIWYMGQGTSVMEILDMLMTICGMVASFDVLMQCFYGLQQEKGEHVASFLTRIEGAMSDIHSKYQNRMSEGDATRLLWQ